MWKKILLLISALLKTYFLGISLKAATPEMLLSDHLPNGYFVMEQIFLPLRVYLKSKKKEAEVRDFISGCSVWVISKHHGKRFYELELCPLQREEKDHWVDGLQFKSRGKTLMTFIFKRGKPSPKLHREELLGLEIDISRWGNYRFLIPELGFFVESRKEGEREVFYTLKSQRKDFQLFIFNNEPAYYSPQSTFSLLEKRRFDWQSCFSGTLKDCPKNSLSLESVAILWEEKGNYPPFKEYRYYSSLESQAITGAHFDHLVDRTILGPIQKLAKDWLAFLHKEGFP